MITTIDNKSESFPFDISIVIPVYNEEKSVEILYSEIQNVMRSIDKSYEIVFIDDGSSDKTFQALKLIKKDFINREKEKLCIIKFSRNFGQTAAMQAGFDRARGSIIISMDGDLQNDPGDIPKFLDKLNEGYDVVCGWRKDRQDKTLTRIIPSKIANWLISKITGVFIHDNGCSLKAYRSSIIKSMKIYSEMHRFIPSITAAFGARVTEIIVNHRARKFGTSKYDLTRVWKVAFDMITIKMLIHFYNKPILWFASLGIIFLFIGVVLAMLSIIAFLKGDELIVYFTSSILFLFLFSSLLSWGLLSEFLIMIEHH